MMAVLASLVAAIGAACAAAAAVSWLWMEPLTWQRATYFMAPVALVWAVVMVVLSRRGER